MITRVEVDRVLISHYSTIGVEKSTVRGGPRDEMLP